MVPTPGTIMVQEQWEETIGPGTIPEIEMTFSLRWRFQLIMMYQTLYQNLVMFEEMFWGEMLFKVFLMEVLFKVHTQRLLFQDPGGLSKLTLRTARMSMTWTMSQQ